MRKLVIRAALACITACVSAVAAAQAYPSKTVRMVHSFGVGSGSDQIARILAAELQTSLKQPFVVDPKPGAAGVISVQELERQPADGYTLMMAPSTVLAANPSLFKKLAYDPGKDFMPIGLICTVPTVMLVDAKLPVNSVAELIAYGRSKPLNYGYGSSTAQIAGAAFVKLNKLADATGVGYKSTPDGLTNLAGGQLSFMFADLPASQGLIQSGRIRPIAIAAEKRSVLLPDLPTMGGFEVTGWASLVGRATMPPDIAAQLNAEMNRILTRKDVADKLLSIGCEVSTTTQHEFASYIQRQIAVYAQKVRESGVEPQ